MSIVEENEIKIMPEMSTSGIASALQIGSSTSTYSFEISTSPDALLLFKQEVKPLEAIEETFEDLLQKLTKKHRQTLDRLT